MHVREVIYSKLFHTAQMIFRCYSQKFVIQEFPIVFIIATFHNLRRGNRVISVINFQGIKFDLLIRQFYRPSKNPRKIAYKYVYLFSILSCIVSKRLEYIVFENIKF